MPQRFLIVANPIAGGGRGYPAATALQEALTGAGIEAELFLTTAKGDARERVRATATAPKLDGLVSVGGDGTLNEVLNGMPDLTVPLATLAMGTANVLARELSLPRKPLALADVLHRGHTRPAHVGTANGRRFLLFVGVGLDGAMVERLEAVRSGTLGKHKWAGPAWHVIRRWPRYDLLVDVHGERDGLGDGPADAVPTPYSSVLVTRVRNYGGLFRLPGGIAIDDGWFHVLGFRQRSRWGWIRAAARAVWGGLRIGRDLDVWRCRHLTVRHGSSDTDVPYQVDGEFGGIAPVELRLLEQPIRLFCADPAARPGRRGRPNAMISGS